MPRSLFLLLASFILSVSLVALTFPAGAQVTQLVGAGSPEGAVSAPVGSTYIRTDGGTDTTLYIKQSGTGNTGWVAVGQATARANTALSNIASVSINAALIPQSGLDLGAQTTPWKDLWLYGSGTFGSHSFRLTGTPTGNRVVTLPDSNTTVPIFSQVITFSGPTAARTVTLPDTNTTVPTATQALTFAGATAARTYTFPDENINVGTLEIRQNSQSAAYTLVLSDAGKHVYHPSADTTARTWTIPANSSVAFPIGTAVTFVNDCSAGTITIAITTDTLVLAGPGTTGSRTLAACGVATAVKVTSTRWIISGTGLT